MDHVNLFEARTIVQLLGQQFSEHISMVHALLVPIEIHCSPILF